MQESLLILILATKKIIFYNSSYANYNLDSITTEFNATVEGNELINSILRRLRLQYKFQRDEIPLVVVR